MWVIDLIKLKSFIEKTKLKQKDIAKKVGLSECQLSLILKGIRRMETSEYANICEVLNMPFEEFLKRVL